MELFLQILGGIGIVVLIVIVVAVLAILIFIKRLKSAFSALAGATPNRIHLKSASTLKFENNKKLEEARKQALVGGLKELGYFEVEEMPALKMNVFMNADQALFAVLYEVPPVGFIADLAIYYDDGSSITATSTIEGEALKQRQEHPKLRSKGASVEELFKLLAQNEKGKARKSGLEESAACFIELFQKAYADEMDWRNSLGGPTEEEIREIARASGGGEPSDEVVARTLAIKQSEAHMGV